MVRGAGSQGQTFVMGLLQYSFQPSGIWPCSHGCLMCLETSHPCRKFGWEKPVTKFHLLAECWRISCRGPAVIHTLSECLLRVAEHWRGSHFSARQWSSGTSERVASAAGLSHRTYYTFVTGHTFRLVCRKVGMCLLPVTTVIPKAKSNHEYIDSCCQSKHRVKMWKPATLVLLGSRKLLLWRAIPTLDPY